MSIINCQLPYFPVENIINLPNAAVASIPLALSGTVIPTNATNKTIVWSIFDAENTGATITGNMLNASEIGTVEITATIVDGLTVGENYTQHFFISVTKAQLAGTVAIIGNAIFGETLTANTAALSATPVVSLGALTYQWKRNGAEITGATLSDYSIITTDIGNTISVTVTAANCNGEVTSAPTATITKISQAAPDAPTLNNSTATSITLNTMSGCEYRMDGSTWQTSTTFDGLTPNTTYSFEARKAETATHFASDASSASPFTTNLDGIEEEFENIKVFSYLNTIYIKNESSITLKSIEVFDMLGRIIYQSAITDTETEITLQVAKSIYTVKLTSQEDKTTVRKMFISR